MRSPSAPPTSMTASPRTRTTARATTCSHPVPGHPVGVHRVRHGDRGVRRDVDGRATRPGAVALLLQSNPDRDPCTNLVGARRVPRRPACSPATRPAIRRVVVRPPGGDLHVVGVEGGSGGRLVISSLGRWNVVWRDLQRGRSFANTPVTLHRQGVRRDRCSSVVEVPVAQEPRRASSTSRAPRASSRR